MIDQDFEALGFSPLQIKLFLFIHKKNSCSMKTILSRMQHSRSSIYRSLSELISMEFIESYYIKTKRHLRLTPLQQLDYAFLNKKRASLQKIEKISSIYHRLYHNQNWTNWKRKRDPQ